MLSKLSRLLLIAGLVSLAMLLMQPVHNGISRHGIPLSLLLAWMGCLGMARKSRWVKFVSAAPVILLLPFLLPGREMDHETLKKTYLSELLGLAGTKYVWGGESRRGIDCSGLARRALRSALLHEGITRGNGRAFRDWAEQWWFDTSAKAMSEGYRGFTVARRMEGKMSGLNPDSLEPGDMAVTQGGVHVLVYLGNAIWIQADPGEGLVTIGSGKADLDPWFSNHVSIHRWSVFSADSEIKAVSSNSLSSN